MANPATRRVRRDQVFGHKKATRRGGRSIEEVAFSAEEFDRLNRDVARLLGLRLTPKGPFATHELIERQLPAAKVINLMDKLRSIHKNSALKALGMSERTVQRHKEAAKPLSPDQSGRVWKFAEILAKATEVFGSQKRAEQWLEQPALGLEQRRPIDLLRTPAGTEIVETLLGRLEYGVYT
jgi:putative toxin-antitoxin system antitoxin component (TIGR02293 family)